MLTHYQRDNIIKMLFFFVEIYYQIHQLHWLCSHSPSPRLSWSLGKRWDGDACIILDSIELSFMLKNMLVLFFFNDKKFRWDKHRNPPLRSEHVLRLTERLQRYLPIAHQLSKFLMQLSKVFYILIWIIKQEGFIFFKPMWTCWWLHYILTFFLLITFHAKNSISPMFI